MTATNKLVSGTPMHVLNVGKTCLIIVGGCALLRSSH
jgi:hypothetical protein